MSDEERRSAAEAWLARAGDDLRSARVRLGHPDEMTAVRKAIDVADKVVGAVRRLLQTAR